MSEITCGCAGCDKRATMHFVRAEARRVAEAISMCDEHGRARIHRHYYSASRVGAGNPFSIGMGLAFDIDFMFWNELQDDPPGLGRVELIEVGGRRKVGISMDSFAWLMLNSELHRYRLPRPPTHRAMAALLEALGARLRHVDIDRVFPADEYIYEAKLHVEHMNGKATVDVRPSDALVLAVICDVPIVVARRVIAALADM